jgi:hypothetical protein
VNSKRIEFVLVEMNSSRWARTTNLTMCNRSSSGDDTNNSRTRYQLRQRGFKCYTRSRRERVVCRFCGSNTVPPELAVMRDLKWTSVWRSPR